MSDPATIHGLDSGGYTWNPDFQAKLDSKGKWTGKESYTCRLNDVTRLLPKIGAKCTLTGWTFLTMTEVEVNNIEGDLAQVTISYSSYQEGGDFQFNDSNLNNYVYDLQIQTNEEPIQTFYKFYKDNPISSDEWSIIRKFINGTVQTVSGGDGYTFETVGGEPSEVGSVSSDAGKKLVDYLAKGVESYYLPRQIWRVTYTTTSRPTASLLNDVGKIKTPKGSPNISTYRNWLFNGLSIQENDKVFTVTEEYILSDLGKWDSYLYE